MFLHCKLTKLRFQSDTFCCHKETNKQKENTSIKRSIFTVSVDVSSNHIPANFVLCAVDADAKKTSHVITVAMSRVGGSAQGMLLCDRMNP